MSETEQNDIPTIDTLNENQIIKSFKEKALKYIKKTAVSNINNERNFINKKLGRDEKTINDVETYYKTAALEAESFIKYYFIKHKDEVKSTDLDTIRNSLDNIDTDLGNISPEKDLNEEVYKMVLKMTSGERIAKIMLEELKTDTNFDIFKTNAMANISQNKGKNPEEYANVLKSIRNSAVTKYNTLCLAYTEISKSIGESDSSIKNKIIDNLTHNKF